MKASNHLLRCLYIILSSATVIIICGVLVYTWHYSNGSLSSQQLEDVYPTLTTHTTEHFARVGLATEDNNNCINNNTMIFSNYAKFHQQSLQEKHNKGRFLLYECNSRCGGYGNRIRGITMSLLFAILSNRTFLTQMNFPFNINRLLHPNEITWNYTGYGNNKHVIKKYFNMIDLQRLEPNWPSFSKRLFNPNVNVITLHTNLGLSNFFTVFDDKWSKLFHDHFNITKDNYISIYGCVVRYLFTYDEVVTDAIKKEMQEVGLIPGLYVSVHLRTYWDAPGFVHHSPGPFLSCAVEIANNMSMNLNKIFKVYFITDSQNAKETVKTEYNGQVLTSHVKEVHVDKVKGSAFEGFIGVMVNIEVAAMGAVFVRSRSSFADLIESIGQFNKNSVIKLI